MADWLSIPLRSGNSPPSSQWLGLSLHSSYCWWFRNPKQPTWDVWKTLLIMGCFTDIYHINWWLYRISEPSTTYYCLAYFESGEIRKNPDKASRLTAWPFQRHQWHWSCSATWMLRQREKNHSMSSSQNDPMSKQPTANQVYTVIRCY